MLLGHGVLREIILTYKFGITVKLRLQKYSTVDSIIWFCGNDSTSAGSFRGTFVL